MRKCNSNLLPANLGLMVGKKWKKGEVFLVQECFHIPLLISQSKKIISLLFFLFVCAFVQAQNRIISGKVLSATDGTPVPSVSVSVKDTKITTLTDNSGNYKIKLGKSTGVLHFSSIGYSDIDIPVGSDDMITVKLEEKASELTQVVVSALGFKENSDRLGSTASKLSPKDIVRSGETGVINGMSGKASGLIVSRSAGDPGAGSYIQIRGQNTITGSNQPLIIVDGIPISNSTIGDQAAGVTQQSRLNDINPDDIASMQILKGASAAALWGSRAANGVIVITTKKGAKDNKVNISFSSTYSFDSPTRLHPLQSVYGQGSGGLYDPNASFSWGDKIAKRSGAADLLNTTGERFEAYNGMIFYPILQKNSTETFQDTRKNAVFRTGTYLDNNLSISGGNDKGTYYFSLGDLRQKGILNGQSDYNRTSMRFNNEKKFNDFIRMSSNATYIRTTSNRVQRSNSVNGLYIGMLRTPPDFDSRGYKGNYYASPTASPITNRQRAYRRYLGNNANPIYNDPLWAINELTNSTEVDRFILSTELVVSPTNWINFTARGGIDNYSDLRITNFPVSSAVQGGAGQYTEEILKETEMNLDLIGKMNKNFGKDITSTLIVGFNINDRKSNSLGGQMSNFIIPDAPPNFTNSSLQNNFPFDSRSHRRMARAYSTVNLGFYNQLYVNISAAGEAGSTFGSEAKSTFYYPSADVAWQFSDLGIFKNSFISFGKLRASYGVVGVQPDAYRNTTSFVTASYGSWGGPVSGSGYGNGAFVQSSRQGDPNLKPERKTEWELGADVRMLHNSLTVGFTYYQNKIVDLLLNISAAGSTGFTEKYTNAGIMENKGLELDVKYAIVKDHRDFNWDIYANWSRNINRVINLAGTDIITLGGFSSTASTVAKTGYALSTLYGGVYLRDGKGNLSLNANGFPQIASSFDVLGDPNPKWHGGFGTNLSYKNFTLNVLFETSQGGQFYTGTQGVLYHFGTHQDVANEVTLTQDLKNYAGKIIPSGSTVRGNIKDFGGGPVLLDQSYYTSIGGGFSTLIEQFIHDASWTRLREVTLGYSLNSKGFRSKTKLQSVDFSVTARNPVLWTKLVGLDPETSLNGAGNSRGQDYFNSPNTKSIVLSLKINY